MMGFGKMPPMNMSRGQKARRQLKSFTFGSGAVASEPFQVTDSRIITMDGQVLVSEA